MKKNSILLVQEDTNLAQSIIGHLTKNGYEVDLAQDQDQALKMFADKNYMISILDLSFAGRTNYIVARAFKTALNGYPMIYLSTKAQINAKLKSLETGHEAYLHKPVDLNELTNTITNLMKKVKPGLLDTHACAIGKYTFDYKNRRLVGNDERPLTRKEAELLKLLCVNKNEVLERNVTLNAIWGKDDYFNGRSMDVFITKLRKYLNDDPTVEIKNIHGVGFKLNIKEHK